MTSWTRFGSAKPVAPARTALYFLAAVVAATLVLPVRAADPSAQSAAPAQSQAPAKSGAKDKGAKGTDKGAPSPKSQGSYSLGLYFGTQLKRDFITPEALSLERFDQGFKDALSGKSQIEQADIMHIQSLIAAWRLQLSDNNAAAAKKFLADNGKQKDIVTTASGLQYKVVSAGNGNTPQPTDEVKVNYRGTLLDGTEFDSSYKRGEPASFAVNGVIKGWTEALLLMKPGAKFQLYIPPELGYGPGGNGPIPPNSLLKFDVELISAAPAPPKPAPSVAAPSVQPKPSGATH